jgi:hypothetical protein
MRDNPDTVAIKNQTLAKCMKNLLKDETSLGDMEFIFSKYDPSTKISAHRCILMADLTRDGKVVCWGSNGLGQCTVPFGLENVISVSCGANHTAAVTRDGNIVLLGLQIVQSYLRCTIGCSNRGCR